MDDLSPPDPTSGRLEWIGISPSPRAAIVPVQEVSAVVGQGLLGDHHAKARTSRRQVTLIQSEHLVEVGRERGADQIGPELLRRNLVISGIDLLTLKDKRFSIGAVVLEGTGTCPPCNRMEENLGPGGKKTMRGRGGITARVLTGGTLRLGATLRLLA